MISIKIIAEYCSIKSSFSGAAVDLLPSLSASQQRSLVPLISVTMVDNLHTTITALSFHDEEPVDLPDNPCFSVFEENALSLLGRLLNPDCQPMDKMIETMPMVWRINGRVRGVALSNEKFQFIFQREEDMETVLKDRPWSYNH